MVGTRRLVACMGIFLSYSVLADWRPFSRECPGRIAQMLTRLYGTLETRFPDKIWFDPVVTYQGQTISFGELLEEDQITRGTLLALRGRYFLRPHWQVVRNVKELGSDWEKVEPSAQSEACVRAKLSGLPFASGRTHGRRTIYWELHPTEMRLRLPYLDKNELVGIWNLIREAYQIRAQAEGPRPTARMIFNNRAELSLNQIVLVLPQTDASVLYIDAMMTLLQSASDVSNRAVDRFQFDAHGNWVGADKISSQTLSGELTLPTTP